MDSNSDRLITGIAEPTGMSAIDIIPIVIGYPVLLIILGKIYKWKNWKRNFWQSRVRKIAEVNQHNITINHNMTLNTLQFQTQWKVVRPQRPDDAAYSYVKEGDGSQVGDFLLN
jgi:hypothetical protein